MIIYRSAAAIFSYQHWLCFFLLIPSYQLLLLIHRFNNDLCHIVDHLIGHAGVHADPEGVVHDKVSVGQLPCHAVGVGAADLVKARVLDQVAAEQQAVWTLWSSI